MEEKRSDGACPWCGYNEGSGSSPSGSELPPGTPLAEGKYLLGRVLGAGGFGITYLGYDTRLKIKVAIKEYFPRHLVARVSPARECVPHDEKAAHEFEEGLRRFVREAQTAARFDSHPHVVVVKDFFEENMTAYIVMSYIEGQSLADYLAQQPDKRISYQKAVEILLPVLDALEKIHRARLLHRDVSPENIYLTKEGIVKLLDFGTARSMAVGGEGTATVSLKEGYAPIEQYSKQGRQGPWTDIYATAATLYRMITGTIPPASLERLHADTLAPPSQQGVSISPRAERAIMKALSIRMEDRYQHVSPFRRDLLEASRAGILATLIADRRLVVFLGVLLVAAILGVKIYRDSNREEEIPPEALRFIGKDPGGNPLPPTEKEVVDGKKKGADDSSVKAKKKKKKKSIHSKVKPKTQKGVAVVAAPEGNEEEEEEEEEEESTANIPTDTVRRVQSPNRVEFVKPNAPRGDPNDLFRQGLGFERAGNRRKALEYYEASCDRGHSVGCYQAAKVSGDRQLYALSRNMFSEECARGKAYACANYGTMLAAGEGGPKDAAKARTVLDQACNMKQAVSCILAATLWEKGEGGVVPDGITAARYYKRACELNAKEGCHRYADLLASGEAGEAKGESAAKYYYWRACSLGDKTACKKQTQPKKK